MACLVGVAEGSSRCGLSNKRLCQWKRSWIVSSRISLRGRMGEGEQENGCVERQIGAQVSVSKVALLALGDGVACAICRFD